MRALVAVPALLAAAACGPSGGDSSACKDTILAGDLVITEVFADYAAPSGGGGTDAGKEWFEIYNNADRPLELKGMTIVHSRPDGSKAQQHKMGDVTIAPGQYYTLGNTTPDLLPAYVDYGYSTSLGDFYNTDGGKLALKCGDAEIDSAVYDGVKSGHSRELSSAMPPDYTFNDDQANWCQGNDLEFDSGNFGTPGQDNDCTPVVMGACSDNGTMRDVVTPVPGDLVITEVMPNPAKVSDTVGEWFEIKAIHDFDLNGLGLDRAGDSSAPNVISSPSCLPVKAGNYAVFAKSTDMTMNGGLPNVAATFSFSLVDGTVAAPGDVQIVAGSTVLDAITWTKTSSGKAHQLDPDLTDPIANDQETNFCDATAPYGAGDLGTPGADNGQCTMLPPAGMCDDGGTLRPIVKPAMGQLVITEVMVNPKVESPAGVQEWFEIQNTGSTAFDLNELGLDQAAGTRPPDIIKSAKCQSVAPGAFALFAHTADPLVNGGLMDIDATYGFTLSNSGADVQVVDGATVLDSVTWGSVSTAAFDGKSLQLDPDFTAADANDMATGAGTKWCVGQTPYGDNMNLGTPKAANAQCAGI